MAGLNKYQAYLEYKDSGVEWLGYAPTHWKVTRLKLVAYINMGQSPSSDDCNIDGNGLAFLQGNAEFGKINPLEKQYCSVVKKIANPGELLFSVRAPVGAINFADKKYGIGRGLCSIAASTNTLPNFLWWLLPTYKYQLDAIATGSTFEAVSAEQLGNLCFTLPPVEEQERIVEFLDHETAKIDNLIEKQQQLIELLKEKRQAVISHAVTKGLNPDVPMKDSGVEWLGEVPEHWSIQKFKYICRSIIAGPFGSSITKDMYVKGGYKVYGQEQVIPNDFHIGDYYLSDSDFKKLSRYEVKTGDILISCVGTFGKIAVFPDWAEDGIINPRLIKASLNNEFNPFFVREFLKSETVFKQFELLSRGGTMGVINISILNEILTSIPPIVEQNHIVNFISSQKKIFKKLIKKATNQIDLLQERRTALISAAVTGKIDVRNWVAPDTQEVEESQEAAA
ncbi:restriction endonuclease subunit S [Xenorhabdus sp. SGI246]|uniref:restriction endonuclease subunit S n=1 Tax=Xenorhabdus sp. SGI246 TaxID=3158263 RepID=UPI00349F1B56